MLRGFRHTLFLLIQIGVVVSAGVALLIWPESWRAVAVCLIGALLATLICERIASRYLRRTLGRLRRVADDLGHGRQPTALEAQPGDDFYKLVSAINLVATRLSEASQEEKRLQDELRRRERLAFLGELAASVAHEVNNPLDGIQNCSRILRRSLDDPQRARQMLDLIDNGLARIHLIVRRLLTLAREHVIRPVEARMRDVVEAALAASATDLEDREIRVQKHYELAEDWVSVDPPLLEQVFVNILRNAAESMSHGGELTVTVRGETCALDGATERGRCNAVCVDIADTGAGIAPDVLPRIFEPFYTTRARGRGTGLGLAIAARIVDAHDGAITVRSELGRGTVFSVRIPAGRAAAGRLSRQTRADASGAGQRSGRPARQTEQPS